MRKGLFPLLLRAVGFFVAAQLMCFMFAAMTMAYYKYTLLAVIDAAASLFIFGAMLFTCASNTAKKDMKSGGELDVRRPFALAFFSALPTLGLFVALLLSKIGLFGNFFVVYRIADAHLIPLIYIMGMPSEATLLGAGELALLGAFALMPAAVVYVTYTLTYRNRDVLEALIYEERK